MTKEWVFVVSIAAALLACIKCISNSSGTTPEMTSGPNRPYNQFT